MDQSITLLLQSLGSFSDKENQRIAQAIEPKHFAENDYLLKQGQVCSSIYWIVSGCAYQYKLNDDLEQQVIDMNVSHNWVFNHRSFTTRKPSEYAIKAFEDSQVYELSIDAIHQLIAESPTFLQMGKVLEEATSRLIFFDNNHSPDEKYQFIIKHKPALLQKFPQKMVASYLKITPETLSRVRRRFSQS
jgi:CRP-like cAMP-binding protein